MKKANVLFITIFILLLLAPSVAMPFFKDAENTEKRTLATFPTLRTEEGKFNAKCTDEFDAWVSDHIGFRSILLETNSIVQSKVFHQSSEDSIVLGKNGWLFYADTVKDYVNTPSFTVRNANNVAHTLSMVQDYVTAKDCKFVVSFIPNKNTLYRENMPSYYLAQDQDGNLELLEKALQDANINYANVREAFSSQDEVLYQMQDSHWNYKGALLGYQTILEKSGANYNSFANMTFTEKNDWESDLAVMLYSTKAEPGNQLYPDYDFNYLVTSHETAVDSLQLTTYNELGNGNAVVYRDSFTNTMQVYVAESFENAYFTRVYPYQIDSITKYDADVAIIELVERNLANLTKRAPVMQAPAVKLDVAAESLGKKVCKLYQEKSGNYYHFYGYVDESVLGDEYQIYLLCNTLDENGNNKMNSYEAFPIYEFDLLTDEHKNSTNKDNGFSLYLAEEQVREDDTYYVMVSTNGKNYISGEIVAGIKE